MLFDEALASPTVQRVFGENVEAFRREMLNAQRFDLSQPFAAAADEIVQSNPQAQYTARSMVRPPYEVSWWEVVHTYRPGFMKGPIEARQAIPKRIGVLVREFEDQPGSFLMDMFYSIPGGEVAPCMISAACDLTDAGKVRLAMGGAVGDPDASFAFVKAPFVSPRLHRLLDHAGARAEQNNWRGEVRFWPVAMMLLNSRNIAYADTGATDKRHARLVKEGKAPLTTFSVCKIKMDRIGRRGSDEPSNSEATLRAHFVRGHFKTRKSGVYWWRPFVRGDVKKGFAGKTYGIEGAP